MMIFKRTITMFICIALLLSGVFIVPGWAISPVVPDVLKGKVEEPFNGTTIPDLVTQGSNITYTQNNGKLNIYGTTAFSRTKLALGETTTGDWVVDITLSRPSATAQDTNNVVRIYTGSNYVTWWDGLDRTSFKFGNETYYVDMEDYGLKSSMHYVAYYNSRSSEFSHWMNDQYVGTYTVPESMNMSISEVQVTTHALNAECNIEDFKYYIPKMQGVTDDEVIDMEYNILMNNGILSAPVTEFGYVVSNVILPTTGDYGSTIGWVSSHNDIINAATGVVTRGSETTDVTLTATISYGSGREKTAEFGPYTVPAMGISVEVEVPLVLTDKFFEDFTGSTVPSMVTTSTSASYTQENSLLKIKSSNSASFTRTTFSLGEITSGDWVVKMDVTRPFAADYLRLYFGSIYIGWSNAGDPFLYLNGVNNSFDATEYGTANTMFVTAYYNSISEALSFWVNNKKVGVYDVSGKNCSLSDVQVTTHTAGASCHIDSVSYFIPKPVGLSAKQMVEKDYAYLMANGILEAPLTENGYMVDDIALSAIGRYGSSITWTSTNSDVVDPITGYVTRGETEAEVSLSGIISADGTQSKTIDLGPYKIPAKDAVVDNVPVQVGVALRNKFNEDSSLVQLRNGPNGIAQVHNGVLEIVSNSVDVGSTGAYLYLNEERTAVGGVLGFEFTMERSALTNYMLIWPNGNSNRLTDIRWTDLNLSVYTKETGSLLAQNFPLTDFDATSKVKVTLLMDTDNGLATVLFNNKLAIKDAVVNAGPISHLSFFTEQRINKMNIDNFKVFYGAMDDARVVSYDKQETTDETLFGDVEIMEGVIAHNIALPRKGNRGSTITWESSHPSVIATDGTVTRPAENTEVTLKATFTSGEETAKREYKITVLQSGEGDLEILKQDFEALTLESILTETMPGEGLITKNLNLYTAAKHGSTISWHSTNENLIKPDGTVARPIDGSNDVYVTLTATVRNGDFSLKKSFILGVVPNDRNVSYFPEPTELELVHLETFKKHTPEIDGDGERNYVNNLDNNLKYNIAPHAQTRGWNGYVEEHDGWVEMHRNANEHIDLANSVASTSVTLPFLPSKENIGDLATLTYKVKKEGNGAVTQYIRGDGGVVTVLTWNSDGRFKVSHQVDGKVADFLTEPYSGETKITILSDAIKGKFSIWFNGECVGRELIPQSANCRGLTSLNANISGTNYIHFYFSDVRVYKAHPENWLRPEYDKIWLTEDMIRGIYPVPAEGKLNADLDLVSAGRYGSTITWQSSDESLISNEGVVTRPQELGYEPIVTMTATIQYDVYKQTKEFTFKVMPVYAVDERVAETDLAFLTLDNFKFFSFDDADPNAVTTSLSLPTSGPYGSTYLWQSNNQRAITNCGRVIRERWDGTPQDVTMKAVVVYGTAVKTKEFNFTVLPDEEIKDPKHMSDEEFFGVWENGTWVSEGKFNYSYPGLSAVEAAVKNGNNYEKAKIELLAYMRNRPENFLSSGTARNPGLVDGFVVTGVHTTLYAKNYQAIAAIRSNEYQQYEIPVSASYINKGSANSYKIGARYNEDTTLRILSREYEDPELRPKMILMVDGRERVYPCDADMVIRGGSNRYTNFGDEVEMEVTMFGPLQGEDTADTVLNFSFTDLTDSHDVSDARLVITAKIEEQFADLKEILVYLEGSDWIEDTTNMDTFIEVACNYNGIPGGNTWHNVKNTESEYMAQHVRQAFYRQTAAEYVYTGDEKYAYAMIWNLMDFIRDTQGTGLAGDWIAKGWLGWSDWDSAPGGLDLVPRRGAYPQALDTAMKLTGSIIPALESVMDSPYMTPDACTAIIKNVWDGIYELERFLSDPRVAHLGGNQKIYEAVAFVKGSMFMPEFKISDSLIESGIDVMENLVTRSYFADGAYIESTDGYSTSVMTSITDFWNLIKLYGLNYSKEIQERIYKAAIYNSLIVAPRGISIAWGDNGKTNPNLTPKNEIFYELYPDEEFLFVNSYGRKGVMPEWTSKLYEGPMVALMRSDWTDDAMFTLMSTSGYGDHGHPDANSMSVNAFGRSFLIDPGYYNYDGASPIRQYMTSTKAHNTVEVDNTTQSFLLRSSDIDVAEREKRGEKHNWTSNKEYDFYSVTSHAYDSIDLDTSQRVHGVKHRRTVTMVKPNFWIVSDLMTPPDDATPHSYKQLWHMENQSNLAIDTTKKTIYSNFNSGANMMLASADADVTMTKEMGWDTFGWGIAEEAPYAYYEKTGVTGKQTFDTVILPYENEGNVQTERLVTGLSSHDVTALKIVTTVDDEVNNTYYMFDYDHISGSVHTFGEYVTDAELALVREAENGDCLEVIINNGSYVKNRNGDYLLKTENHTADVSYEVEGDFVKVYATDDAVLNNVEIKSDTEVKGTLFNSQVVEFEKTNGKITFTGNEGIIEEENDSSAGIGGIMGTITGGGGNAGGSIGGGAGSNIGGGTIVPDASFEDVENHWAKDAIVSIAKAGIVNGYGEEFLPDKQITRAELIAIAVRAAKLNLSKYKGVFTDVNQGEWYADVIQTALDKGIISSDERFRPNDVITREEMCKIIVLTAKLMNVKEETKAELNFADNNEIAPWATEYIQEAVGKGLMHGMDNQTFAPKASATRAQAATVFYRILFGV